LAKDKMAVAIGAPIATIVCAWFERWALAQVFWLFLLIVVMGFEIEVSAI